MGTAGMTTSTQTNTFIARNWRDLIRPRKLEVDAESLTPTYGKFTCEPLERGFGTPLGNSLPPSANGSMAPLAPDPSCSLRTMRALGDEQFDVLHLHEPFVPGPTQTAMLLHPAPVLATFQKEGPPSGSGGGPCSSRTTPDRPAPASHRP